MSRSNFKMRSVFDEETEDMDSEEFIVSDQHGIFRFDEITLNVKPDVMLEYWKAASMALEIFSSTGKSPEIRLADTSLSAIANDEDFRYGVAYVVIHADTSLEFTIHNKHDSDISVSTRIIEGEEVEEYLLDQGLIREEQCRCSAKMPAFV